MALLGAIWVQSSAVAMVGADEAGDASRERGRIREAGDGGHGCGIWMDVTAMR